MPVARILTRFPERTSALAEDLQHRGYTVEVTRPGDMGLAPADLEIDFEICNNEDAVQRARELAVQWSADVAVSPGVGELAPLPEPALATTTQEDDIVVIPPAEQVGPVMEPVQPETLVQSELLPKHAEVIRPEAVQLNSSAADLENPDIGEMPLHDQVTVDTTGVVQQRESAEIVEERETITERAEPQADYAQKARELSAAALNSGKALAASSGEWLRRNSEALRQQIDLKLAELRARREIRHEQAEKRKSLAVQRAAELEAAREAAAVRLQELLRERGGLTESQPAPPQAQPVMEPQTERRTAAAGAASFFKKHMGFSFHSGISPQLEAVLMGVAAACALFVLGLAVASFHASPAISKTVSVGQQYKGVTVDAGGVTLKPTGAATTATAPAAPVAANPAPANTRGSVARPSPVIRSASSQSSASHSGNTRRIGNDVVIRRLDQPKASASHGGDVTIRQFGAAKPAARNATPPGPKKISDLDQ